MRTKIIYKFRVLSIKGYEKDWDSLERYWWGYTLKMKRNIFGDHYELQQKRRFWFGYKTIEKSGWKDELIEKMETLKEIYGEYA